MQGFERKMKEMDSLRSPGLSCAGLARAGSGWRALARAGPAEGVPGALKFRPGVKKSDFLTEPNLQKNAP